MWRKSFHLFKTKNEKTNLQREATFNAKIGSRLQKDGPLGEYIANFVIVTAVQVHMETVC